MSVAAQAVVVIHFQGQVGILPTAFGRVVKTSTVVARVARTIEHHCDFYDELQTCDFSLS